MSQQWYIRFPQHEWVEANAHQKNAVGVLIRNGGNAQTINVPHTRGGLFSARFDTIKHSENNEMFTTYTPLHVDWDTYKVPATGQIYYVHKESGRSQWDFPPADSKVEMTFCLPTTVNFANRLAADFGGGGGNLNYRKNKISINLHNRRRNRYRSHRYRKNKHIINLYKRARKGTRRLS